MKCMEDSKENNYLGIRKNTYRKVKRESAEETETNR